MRKKMLFSVIVSSAFLVIGLKPCLAADPLVAIDILQEPDDTMIARAKADNERVLENYPAGFALDATHTAHISVLQCYVHEKDPGKILDAVKKVNDSQSPAGMELKTTRCFSAPWQGSGRAGITVERTEELLAYQKAILAAVAPFLAKKGTLAAFVPNENGAAKDATIAAYVNAFVLRHTGKGYGPHITIGLGREDFVKAMIAEPFMPRTFKVKCVSVYQLGDFGAARKKLWYSWELKFSGNSTPGAQEMRTGAVFDAGH